MEEQLGEDMFSAAFKANAFPVYAGMREQGPVVRLDLPTGATLCLVTRYDEAAELLKSHERFANDPLHALTEDEYAQFFQRSVAGLTPEEQEMAAQVDEILGRNLLSVDPPDHSRLRRLVAIPFTPKYIDGLRPRIQEIANTLLDQAERRARAIKRREMELILDFAYPLPLTVIAEMLGIPADDRENFRVWSNAAVAFTPTEPPDPEMTALLGEFIVYLRQLVAEKRAHPGDDLLTGLVQAEAEGDKLSEHELLSMIFLLIVAGHETTVNLIGNGTLALFDHPEQFALLRSNPDLLKPAIEEMLRYSGPVEMSLTRWVRADTELGGVAPPPRRAGHCAVGLRRSGRRAVRRSRVVRYHA